MKSKDELRELDKKYMFHPVVVLQEHEEKGARVMVEAEGSRVKDIDGNEYIDAFSSLWNVVIGHGQKAVADAITAADNTTRGCEHQRDDECCLEYLPEYDDGSS